MGGIAFLFSVMLTSLFFMKSYPQIIPILFMTVGFGFVGFLDDYIKVVRKHSEGLNPKQKMAAQFVITAIFCFYMMNVFRRRNRDSYSIPSYGLGYGMAVHPYGIPGGSRNG